MRSFEGFPLLLRRTAGLGLLTLIFLTGPPPGAGLAVAQDSDALQRVQERAKYLNDFKALLNHSDASVRAAAVQEALAGTDADLRSMALETALAGNDDKLQTTALRWIIGNRNNVAIKVELPDKPTEAEEIEYNAFHGKVLKELKLNPQSDEFSANSNHFTEGHLIRGGLEASFFSARAFSCVLTAKVAEKMLLTGALTCTLEGGLFKDRKQGSQRAVLPVRIDLS